MVLGRYHQAVTSERLAMKNIPTGERPRLQRPPQKPRSPAPCSKERKRDKNGLGNFCRRQTCFSTLAMRSDGVWLARLSRTVAADRLPGREVPTAAAHKRTRETGYLRRENKSGKGGVTCRKTVASQKREGCGTERATKPGFPASCWATRKSSRKRG